MVEARISKRLKGALKRYGSGYPETGKRVAGHRFPGDMVRGKVKYAANSGETMINASTTRLDFYLHALPAVHRDNSLLYDYLTGHTCGKGQACAPILAKLSTITMLNYRPTVFSTCYDDPRADLYRWKTLVHLNEFVTFLKLLSLQII